MGAYLIKECKEEYLNLIVIDTGILWLKYDACVDIN
jgi:hypothetical protein